MKAVLSILRKEFIQLRRDPRLFPVIFISPVLQLLLLGYAANLDIKNIELHGGPDAIATKAEIAQPLSAFTVATMAICVFGLLTG
jgi:ABC-2 type transport system permease protein